MVPEGVDYNTFRPATTRSDSGVFRFLCVGKWEVRKGTADLVRAFYQEFVSGEPVELAMHCGAPWPRALDYRAEIGKIVDESDQPPRVVARDPQPRADLVALMQSSDAFALPTRGEGWGLPVLEAMACGLPCIVTGYAGLKEFANETNAFLIRVAAMQRVNDPEFYPPEEDWGQWAQPDGEPSADVPVNGHRETWPLRSSHHPPRWTSPDRSLLADWGDGDELLDQPASGDAV